MQMDEAARVISEVQKGNYTALLSLSYFPCPELTGVDALQYCYDILPDDKKYKIVLDIYQAWEGPVRCMKKYIRDIRKYRPQNYLDDLPEELSNSDLLTVYRGGSECLVQTEYATSWTLDKEKAVWFAKRKIIFKLPAHLYEGVISKRCIIAYLDGRSEKEVLQYGSVREVREIFMD